MFDNVLNRENNIQKVSTSLVPSYVLYTLFGKSIIHDCFMELKISRVIFDSMIHFFC